MTEYRVVPQRAAYLIDNCADCPHFSDADTNPYCFKAEMEMPFQRPPIPDWCPLEKEWR